jgi:pimeloyl-ACP methyl ester carboxylesterase
VGGLIFIDDDRANIGSSDAAPTPRTAAGVVSDLHQLLETADVPGPYVLVGYGNGGFFVQLYGRRYSDEVEGVVVMNPGAPTRGWSGHFHCSMNKCTRRNEPITGGTTTSTSTGWPVASSWRTRPSHRPCPSRCSFPRRSECLSMPEGRQPCLESHEVYKQVTREVTQQWPESSYR